MDPTLAYKIIIHEGLHQKWKLAKANKEIEAYPTLFRHSKDPNLEADHETMAEGYISTFVEGMKQFDKAFGAEHSEEWYNAMAWWGSLSRATNSWKNIDSKTKAIYESIQINEYYYIEYQKAKIRYNNSNTEKNKSEMESSFKKIDQKLFNQTRNKPEDEKIE
jgi:hypothetical protein